MHHLAGCPFLFILSRLPVKIKPCKTHSRPPCMSNETTHAFFGCYSFVIKKTHAEGIAMVCLDSFMGFGINNAFDYSIEVGRS